MAVPLGKGRYYKLFAGSSPPKQLLIEDICEPGLLSDEYVQGIVVKIYPVKRSPKYGKLCKLALKEDVEKATRHSQCAIINVFLLGDMADEGSSICEGDRIVLAKVVAECSPTDEHHFQLVVCKEKSQASMWIISNKGKVRASTANGVSMLPVSSEPEEKLRTAGDHIDDSDEEDNVINESCEYDVLQQTVDNTQETADDMQQAVDNMQQTAHDTQQTVHKIQHKVGEKRKGKFQLGPRGVTPSQAKRNVGNMVVLLDKDEPKRVLKTLQQEESSKFSTSTCTNVSAANISTGQSMAMSQKPSPGGNRQSLSPSIQSAYPRPEQLGNVQCTHIELTPDRVSTRIRNGQSGQGRDLCHFGEIVNDLLQLAAPGSQGHSQSTVVESNVSVAPEGILTGADARAVIERRQDDLQERPTEDFCMTADEEDMVFTLPRKTSSMPSPPKRVPPHIRKAADDSLTPTSSTRSLIPQDYTPAATLLACSKGGVQRTPLQQVLDPKRLSRSLSPEAGPSRRSPSPDRADKAFPARAGERSSRRAADYIVPPGYTTLANLQAETTVNVYGVVKLFKPAWKCRGTDMCSVLVSMDPTVAESAGLECVLFQPNVSRLPSVYKVGDIVRLHRIKISQYQGRLQAKSSRGFAAIVFDRDTELPVTAEMARVSSSTFTLTQSDKETVASLKEWCDDHPILFPPSNFLTVSQVSPDSYFDLVCHVLGVALHRTLDCVVLYVTDGTRPKRDLRKCQGDDYNMVEPPNNIDENVVSVFLYGSHAEVARLLARKDRYVILHNVHSQVLKPGGSACSVLDVVDPYLELCVHRGTAYGRGLSVLPPDSPEVKRMNTEQSFQ